MLITEWEFDWRGTNARIEIAVEASTYPDYGRVTVRAVGVPEAGTNGREEAHLVVPNEVIRAMCVGGQWMTVLAEADDRLGNG